MTAQTYASDFLPYTLALKLTISPNNFKMQKQRLPIHAVYQSNTLEYLRGPVKHFSELWQNRHQRCFSDNAAFAVKGGKQVPFASASDPPNNHSAARTSPTINCRRPRQLLPSTCLHLRSEQLRPYQRHHPSSSPAPNPSAPSKMKPEMCSPYQNSIIPFPRLIFTCD